MTSSPTPAATTPVDDGEAYEATEVPAQPAVTSSSAHADPAPANDPVPVRRRARRHRRWVLVTALVLLLAASIAAGAYLWQVAEAWIDRDAQWQSHSSDLTSSLGVVTSDLEDTQAELEVVRGQLDEAQLRISELADEKAKLGDEHAVVRQLAEYQERVSVAATAVVSALDSCIASQQRLIRWHIDTEEPEPEDLEAYETLATTLNEVCSAAQQAKDSLQDELEG